jgi:toxin HigB-1
MILNFRHKGLARLYAESDQRGLPGELVSKSKRILARLDVATNPGMMNVRGWRLHPLKGQLKGFWSIWISGNWRIIFRFSEKDVVDVDLVDYH